MYHSFISILSSPLTWVVFTFGIFFGSFFNVCIFRIPEKTFFSKARSLCRHCGAKVPFYLNIPVFAYFFLRGKTACCKKPLSPQYPIVEFLTGVLFVFTYWQFPFIETYNQSMALDAANLIRFFHGVIFLSILLICSVIDLQHMIIPDVLSLPMIVLTPLVAYLHPELKMVDALLGVVVGGGSLYLVAWIYWLIRKEVGMGFGDVKLLAGIGGWLGYQSIFPTIFYAAITGTLGGLIVMIIKRQMTLKIAIPFGPFLAFGAGMYLFMGLKLLYLF